MAYVPPYANPFGSQLPPKAYQSGPPPQPPPNSPPSILQQYLDLLNSGPDYSRISTPDYDAIAQMAQHEAEKAFVPIEQFYERERAQTKATGDTSKAAAQNFSKAMAEILTGGQGDEAARQAYAKENFGGSYMAAIAAQMGTDMVSRITHDFTKRDFELAGQLADTMAKLPEVKQQILGEIMQAEQERYQSQIDVADETFERRLKRAAALFELERELSETGGDEPDRWSKPYRLKGTNELVQRNLTTGQIRRVADVAKPAGKAATALSDSEIRQNDRVASTAYWKLIDAGVDPKKALTIVQNQLPANYPGRKRWTPSAAYMPDQPEDTTGDDRQAAWEDVVGSARSLANQKIPNGQIYQALRAEWYGALNQLGYTDVEIRQLLWRAIKAAPKSPTAAGKPTEKVNLPLIESQARATIQGMRPDFVGEPIEAREKRVGSTIRFPQGRYEADPARRGHPDVYPDGTTDNPALAAREFNRQAAVDAAYSAVADDFLEAGKKEQWVRNWVKAYLRKLGVL